MLRSMGDKAAKQRLFDGFASVARAMASGRRAEILDVLAQGPRSVEEVAGEIGQSVANTSHHLRTMAGAGLLTSRREGTRIIYRLAGPNVLELWRQIQAVAAKQVAEIQRLAADYLGDRRGLEPVAPSELTRRMKRGGMVVLDVRPEPEFAAGHIAGARSIPVRELWHRLKEIPKGAAVVAYCRGPYCVFADDAVRLLRKKGFSASRLEDGFPAWRDAGLPTAAGLEG